MSHQVCVLQHVFLMTQFSVLMFVRILYGPYFLHIIADLFSVIHVLYILYSFELCVHHVFSLLILL
jgi:hypothetical protein